MNTAADMYPAPETPVWGRGSHTVCVRVCAYVCLCACMCRLGVKEKSTTSLLKGAPAGPQPSCGSQSNVAQEPLVLSGYWPKKLLRAGSQTQNTHTRASLAHTSKHDTHTAVPRHVLSDGKSGLPFCPVHQALMSTIRLSLDGALCPSMNVKYNSPSRTFR